MSSFKNVPIIQFPSLELLNLKVISRGHFGGFHSSFPDSTAAFPPADVLAPPLLAQENISTAYLSPGRVTVSSAIDLSRFHLAAIVQDKQ